MCTLIKDIGRQLPLNLAVLRRPLSTFSGVIETWYSTAKQTEIGMYAFNAFEMKKGDQAMH